MLCRADDSGFRLHRNDVQGGRTVENQQRDWRRCRRAGGCEGAGRLVMCGIVGPRPIATGRRLRALRQRPGPMAHLHGGRVIGTGARHESRRHQHAARQGGQQQQRDPELGPAVSCPVSSHRPSLGQGRRIRRPAVIRSPPLHGAGRNLGKGLGGIDDVLRRSLKGFSIQSKDVRANQSEMRDSDVVEDPQGVGRKNPRRRRPLRSTIIQFNKELLRC